jgi:hypothetical protein
MMNREYFHKYSKKYGPFDLDGASDNDGLNSQVPHPSFCCPKRPFQEQDLKNYRRIWLNAPYEKLEEFLGHYLRQKLLYPHLRATFVVPKWTRKPWFKLLKNFRLVDELQADQHVFTCPTNDEQEGARQDVGPTRWPTQVYCDESDTVAFLPQQLRTPPKTYWTHSKTLVTDGERVLLTIEDNGLVWFPGGGQEPADLTPEQTAVRELFEETGYRAQEPHLRLLGTQSAGEKKFYVYLHRVRPTSVPDKLPSDLT